MAVVALGQNPQAVPASRISQDLLTKDSQSDSYPESGNSIEDMIAKRDNYDEAQNAYVVAYNYRDEHHVGGSIPRSAQTDLDELALNCDAIVLATPLHQVSYLTASHHFIFSDYEVTVDSVYMDRHHYLNAGSQIVVNRLGGEMIIGGAQFRAIEPEFPQFRLNIPYIYFLHFHPSSGSFGINPSGAYRIEGDQVIAGRVHSTILPNTGMGDKSDFMADLQSAVNVAARYYR